MRVKLTLTTAATLTISSILTGSAAQPGPVEEPGSEPLTPKLFVRVEDVSQWAGERGITGKGNDDLATPKPALQPYGPVPEVELSPERIARAITRIAAGASGDKLIVNCHGHYDHQTIQGAIDAATDGDVVVILPNTCNPQSRYFENINFLGKTITVQSLFPENPDVVAATVISGALVHDSVATFTTGEGEDSVLDGLTLTGGQGKVADPLDWGGEPIVSFGGALYLKESSPTIRNCQLTNNHANWGGAVFGHRGSPTITNCDITNNLAYEMSEYDSNGLLWGAAPYGGGLCFIGSVPAISQCRIVGNTADINPNPGGWPGGRLGGCGAGISLMNVGNGNGEIEITNCEVSQNRLINGHSVEYYCQQGGGLFAYAYSPASMRLSIRNSLFVDNVATYAAGIFAVTRDEFTLQGCTIAGNVAYLDDLAGIDVPGEVSHLSSSVIFHNLPEDINDAQFQSADVSYSNIHTSDGSVIDGPGNINTDPLFVDVGMCDYHLSPASPCIEAGDPNFVPEEGETDIDGDPRVICDIVDMGADEVQSLLGDVNRNGQIDKDDLHAMVDLLAAGDPSEADLCTADLDGDGDVDFDDLHLLLDLVFEEVCEAKPIDFNETDTLSPRKLKP